MCGLGSAFNEQHILALPLEFPGKKRHNGCFADTAFAADCDFHIPAPETVAILGKMVTIPAHVAIINQTINKENTHGIW